MWLDTARSALIEEGTAGVEINKLAKRLGVSRGGFYWFFKGREQLMDELLAYWARTGTVLFERLLKDHGRNGIKEYRALIHLWVDEKEYDPKWDGAVRDWARLSPRYAQNPMPPLRSTVVCREAEYATKTVSISKERPTASRVP